MAHTSCTLRAEVADPNEFSLVSTKQVTHTSVISIDHYDHLEQKLLLMVLYIPNLDVVLRQVIDPSNPDSKHQVLFSLVL